MNKRSNENGEQATPASAKECPPAAFQSGLLCRLGIEVRPSWDVVEEYLESGKHTDWVEGYAARSPGFAYVLERQKNARAKGERDEPAGAEPAAPGNAAPVKAEPAAPAKGLGRVLPFRR
jgi:hypothetical protein